MSHSEPGLGRSPRETRTPPGLGVPAERHMDGQRKRPEHGPGLIEFMMSLGPQILPPVRIALSRGTCLTLTMDGEMKSGVPTGSGVTRVQHGSWWWRP